MRFIKNLLSVVLLFTCLACNSNGQESKSSKKVLNLISDFADRICGSIPLGGHNDRYVLSAEAKAELDKVLKKIAALGIKFVAQYQGGEYYNVLQTDLAKALNDSLKCKYNVFQDLKERLLPPISSPFPQPHTNTLEISDGETKCIDNNICFKFSKHYQSGLILLIAGRKPEEFDIYKYPQEPYYFQYKDINYFVEADLGYNKAIISIRPYQ